jgi:hypothetical protein
MTGRFYPRHSRAAALAVAALLAVGGAAFAPAVFAKSGGGKTTDDVLFNPADRQALHDYRLSMDTAAKCHEAWKKLLDSADKDPAIRKEMATHDEADDADVHSIADMIKLAETKAPVSTAFLKQNDCAFRDTVMMFMESMAIEVAGFMKQMGKENKELDFVAPENVEFYEKNGPQLKEYVEDIQAMHKAKFPDMYKDEPEDTPDDDAQPNGGGDE